MQFGVRFSLLLSIIQPLIGWFSQVIEQHPDISLWIILVWNVKYEKKVYSYIRVIGIEPLLPIWKNCIVIHIQHSLEGLDSPYNLGIISNLQEAVKGQSILYNGPLDIGQQVPLICHVFNPFWHLRWPLCMPWCNIYRVCFRNSSKNSTFWSKLQPTLCQASGTIKWSKFTVSLWLYIYGNWWSGCIAICIAKKG